ncbi:MAG: tail fiber domain-containing protein [Ferruginibacter sp.]
MKKILLCCAYLCLHVLAIAQPANDEPCNAINIPLQTTGCEPTTVYSWTGATESTAYGNTYCNGSGKRDVWYKLTVPANGRITARIAMATTYDMAAEFYTSTSCNVGGLTIFNQSTIGFPCMYASSSSGGDGNFINLTPGSTVYVRVYQLYYGAANADIKMCFSTTNTLADEPCNAGFYEIESADPLGQSCYAAREFTWSGATLTPAIPNPSCTGSMPAANIRDVWFKVKVPASGKLTMNSTSIPTNEYVWNRFAMTVYTASSCSSGFTEIGCGLDGTPMSWNNLTPNSTIYVRLFSWSGGVDADNTVKVCVAAKNDVPAIDNSKKVGIGIDSPFAKLDVVGNAIVRDKLTAGSDLEVRGNLLLQGNLVGKYGTAVLQGNTTIQGGPLKIDSLDLGSRLGNRIALYGGLGNSGKYGFGIQSGLMQLYSDVPSSNIAFGYGNSYSFTERARFVNQGEVGLNLTGRLQLRTGTNSAGVWMLNTANTQNAAFMGMAADNLTGFYSAAGAGWGFTMNTSNANVGIGLNGGSPLRPLSFPATLGEKILLYPGSAGEVGIGVYGNELRLHSDNANAKVSFGTQTNAGVFTENAKAERSGVYAFSVFGSIWANGTTYASDERFKKNISPIASPLQKLLQLKGVEYEMETEKFSKMFFSKGRQMGLLAQNVEQVVPEAVNEIDGYKGVDYARLVPLLIESIKELKQEVEELKARLNNQP